MSHSFPQNSKHKAFHDMKSINLAINTISEETPTAPVDTSVTRNKTNFAAQEEHENKFVTFCGWICMSGLNGSLLYVS